MFWKTTLALATFLLLTAFPSRADQDVDWFTAQNQAIPGHDGHITLPDAQEFRDFVESRNSFLPEDQNVCGISSLSDASLRLHSDPITSGLYIETGARELFLQQNGWLCDTALRNWLCFQQRRLVW